MSRPLRIEYPDAWYHVMNRGRRGENVWPQQLLKLKELGGNIFGKECTCGGSLMSKNLIRIQPHYGSDSSRTVYLKTDITTKLVLFS
jgi:hypothetical protein